MNIAIVMYVLKYTQMQKTYNCQFKRPLMYTEYNIKI